MSLHSFSPDEPVAFLPHIIWSLVDDEIIVTDLGRDCLCGLEGIGAVIWRDLAQGRTPRQIIEAMDQEYAESEADRRTIRADVERLLQDFENAGWIARSSDRTDRADRKAV